MLEVTDKSLRARRSMPCCRSRDGPNQSAVSSVGPAVARLVRLFPTTVGGISFLPLEEVHRPKPWLNYPAAAAKAMRPLARANREYSDCRIASLSLSPLSHSFSFSSSRCLLVFLLMSSSTSLSLSLLALTLSSLYIAFFHFVLFPSFLSFFFISILYKSFSFLWHVSLCFLANVSYLCKKILIPAPWPLSLSYQFKA